jgi:hypothetical protein
MDHLTNYDLAEANREVLRSFYVVLKDLDEHLQFIFMTGTTKFVQTAVASALNNLIDISLEPSFNAICGFTFEELKTLFSDRFPELLEYFKQLGYLESSAGTDDLMKEILLWYDGYSWSDADRVLNPFSILNFFTYRRFRNYWYATGAPFFLTELIRQNPFAYVQARLQSHSYSVLKINDLKDLAPAPLLFQTGYLTVDKVLITEKIPTQHDPQKIIEETYSFRIPNLEVQSSYRESLLHGLYGLSTSKPHELAVAFTGAILSRDSFELERILGTIFARITYHQNNQNHIPRESFYHSVTQAFMEGLGLDVWPEVPSYKGRSDLDLRLQGGVYVVMEFKYVAASTEAKPDNEEKQRLLKEAVEEAKEQVKMKNYARKYQLKANEIIEALVCVYGPGEVMVRFS